MAKKRCVIKIFGIVQGVGFRPFIHKLVNEYDLKGWVQNSASGVNIDAEGEEENLKCFINDIPKKAPDLALIESIEVEYGKLKGYTDFKIIKSEKDQEGFVLISPDVSICEDCYRELMDPNDKRYRYPFINCTNCGPRFTIIKDLPYDRDKTTMSKFPMCNSCSEEYHNIENRRYHAQPNCCPDCGPSVEFRDEANNKQKGDPIKNTIEKLKSGHIVAIKGLGGFHLACDALNSKAVNELRKRKHREKKPFAMMAKDIETIKKYAYVNESEEKILKSIKKPIVLLKKKNCCSLPDEIAPDTDYLGFMLPYTPLHCLLFENIDLLVMTSANISDNPIIYKNEEAISKLKGIADFFLLHNRDINTRCDDSVLKVLDGKEYFIRRSRGYAPFPIKMNAELKNILSLGAEQKASFSLSRGNYVFLSQHIGDLKNYETFSHYEEQIQNFMRLFKVQPEIVACDLHPDYLSTVYANELKNVQKVYVQHHHAHMASCMADNNLDGDVIGVAWDGTGLGTDRTIWGGEILLGGYKTFKRAGSFYRTPMPGGDKAVEELYKMALSYIYSSFGEEFAKYCDFMPGLREDEDKLNFLYNMIKKRVNSPDTSSCGRLFDGVSALLGICKNAAYEGQGAIMLEKAADFRNEELLDFNIIKENDMYVYDWRGTIKDIVDSIKKGKDRSKIASAFHNTLVEAGMKMVLNIRDDSGLDRVVLSGGVFQNDILLNKFIRRLKCEGFKVFIHNRVSTNDEGISLGQLMIAQYGGGYDVSCGSSEDSINR